MANLCFFELRATGFKNEKDKNAFLSVFSNDSGKTPTGCDTKMPYMAIYETELTIDGNTVILTGDCKWSINTSFTRNGFYKDKDKNSNYTCLEDLSEKYGLYIEVYSEECGFCFQEHYIFENGQVICEDSVDWSEHFIGDYDTYEEWQKSDDFCEDVSEDDFDSAKKNGDSYVEVGGYEWNFDDRFVA